MMVMVDVFGSGTSWFAAIGGKVKATSTSATAVLLKLIKRYPNGVTIQAPAVMALCMKVGDMRSRNDIVSTAAPAYTSSHGRG